MISDRKGDGPKIGTKCVTVMDNVAKRKLRDISRTENLNLQCLQLQYDEKNTIILYFQLPLLILGMICIWYSL